MPHLVMGIVHLVTDREDKSGEPGNGLSVLMQGFIRNIQKAYDCLYEVTNNATFKMPMTGDDGKWKYGFIGFGMVAALGCGYVVLNTKNHKKRNYRKMKKQK